MPDPLADNEVPDESPASVITLVHGTFARNAAWARTDSAFARALSGRLNGKAHFCTFHWSGLNSHSARLRAGAALRAQLEEQIVRFPKARHFIVAHSHGGNVAAYATRDWPRHARAPLAVFCLATPFIHVSMRGAGFFAAIAISAFFGLSLAAGGLVARLTDGAGDALWPVALIGPTALLLLLAVGWAVVAGRRRALRREKALSFDFRRHPSHIRAFRLQRDEARLWLSFILFVTSLPEKAWLGIEWLLSHGLEVLLVTGAASVLFLWIATALEASQMPFASGFGNSGSTLLLASVGLVVAGLPVYLGISAFVWLWRGQIYGFGETLIDSLFLRTSLHDENAHAIAIEAGDDWRRGLRHSQIYANERVIERIASEINGWQQLFARSPRAEAERLEALEHYHQRSRVL